jgi:hypothetical protein
MSAPFTSFPFDASGIDNFSHPLFIGDWMRAPTTNDIYNPGTEVQDNSVNPPVIYETTGGGVWYSIAGGGESLSSLTVTGPTSLTGGTVITGPMSVSGLSTLTGGINTAPVVVAAGASPQTANGRSGQVTFSGVSIAAGATQSFVINNTAVSAIGTVILYSMVGATTGAALNIQSVTNVAGTSSTIVVENGTGATTSTANITFTYIVLN